MKTTTKISREIILAKISRELFFGTTAATISRETIFGNKTTATSGKNLNMNVNFGTIKARKATHNANVSKDEPKVENPKQRNNF